MQIFQIYRYRTVNAIDSNGKSCLQTNTNKEYLGSYLYVNKAISIKDELSKKDKDSIFTFEVLNVDDSWN